MRQIPTDAYGKSYWCIESMDRSVATSGRYSMEDMFPILQCEWDI